MMRKRLLSVLLTGALMVSTLMPGMAVSAAETKSAEDSLVASYDFDNETLDNSVKEGDAAKAIVTGLGDYSGAVKYGAGREGGKAVRLGDYGLQLNQKNLGDNFTVSLWLKPEGTIANNQSVLFLGYHNPELWYALAGRDAKNAVKMWAKGGQYSWTEFGTLELGNDWHQVTITGDGKNLKAYLDGVVLSTTETSNPLTGSNQDIYLGATNWDPEFTGLMDEVKIYNTALTEAEIQAENKEYYEGLLQAKVATLTEKDLLGMNTSADAVTYNLSLPKTVAGSTVEWASSDEKVIAGDGTVVNPAKDTEVTITANVKAGTLTASKTFTFTVKAVDRTALDELIAKAEKLDISLCTKESKDALAAAIKDAKEAVSLTDIDKATTNLHRAIAALAYVEEYADPFAAIDTLAPAKTKEMIVGKSEQLFTIPDSVKDNVTVEYYSSDDSSATYKDGKVTALKEGRVTVTAIVKAAYNGYMEEYSTALNISAVDAKEVVGLAAEEETLLSIKESEINQLLTEDLELPSEIDGMDAEITYRVDDADSRYVSVKDHTLKVTRPYAGEGNYSFTLKADIKIADKTVTQEFPLTIAEGVSADTYAGYVYVCFGNVGGADVQQVHLFLSEDGLNWTALNGFHPIFETGTDYADLIQTAGTHNYTVKEGADISETVSGDASVLFPFEGNDQGIRDPYMIRGCREEDSNKVWILATDLNTMASKYGGKLDTNVVGNWGTMSHAGSTKIFVYETEDWVHWERRYIDVGAEVAAGAAWAPEAVYNPEKDNYLVYWSCRVGTDDYARNRLYCNETKDFKTFGPTKMYEQEAFYKNWGKLVNQNDGYGNIDTSQLWVADEDGNPYGTLYRVVKDETNNHIELMSADTVLDPDVDYDNADANRITPYTFNGKEYANKASLSGLNDYQKAEVVWNWFASESTGNHFQYISQKNMEKMSGAYEGATMFKFNDRDEWCVMIDFYGNNSVRYEPYVTTDLSKADSIQKVSSGYGRTGGDVGCHGGMIPITAAEYNTLIDTYNADTTVDNYHPIEYIDCDKRELQDLKETIDAAMADEKVSDEVKEQLADSLTKAESMLAVPTVNADASKGLAAQVGSYLQAGEIKLSKDMVSLNKNGSQEVTAEVTPSDLKLTWNSADEKVATVADGKIKAAGAGSTFVFARCGRQVLAKVKVQVDVTSSQLPYVDVAKNDWFYDAVAYNYYAKTMTGLDDTHFGPAQTLVRAQFAAVLHKMNGQPETAYNPLFSDVAAGQWFTECVLWAADKKIVTGYSGTQMFGPNDNVTREQMATMMYRYAKDYKKYDVTANGDYNSFPDAANVQPFAKDAMKWAVSNGIITGKTIDEKLMLDPQGSANRAECATIIQRFIEKYGK